MKVIFWSELFWPHIGGVEILTQQLIKALKKFGHNIIVITSATSLAVKPFEIMDGIEIHRLPFQDALVGRDLHEMHRITGQTIDLMSQFQPDVVHIHSSQPSTLFYHLSRRGSLFPTVFTLHEPLDKADDANSLVGRTMLSSNWIAAVSQATLKQARNIVPEIITRSSVIYNALEKPLFQASPLQFDPPRLLCIGRLTREKGFDLAIQALAEIRQRIPGIQMVIAGDGRERNNLKSLAESLGLKEAVEFSGWVQPDRIPELINSASLVIIPSRWPEPFGLVALQSAQMGRPVVAANVGGLPEVVVNNETGLLFEKNDAVHLISCVYKLLQHPAETIRMGKAALERAENFFDLEATASAYDKLYQDIFQKVRSHPVSEVPK
jgi:glycogen(starch) synthase